MMKATVLTLVRHGETSANTLGVWHGSTDTALTERGVEQAARVATYLSESCADAAALYCSPLQRAHRTARCIGEAVGLAPQVDDALVEFDLGRWEGKSYLELHEQHRLWHHMKSDPDFAPHGGESPRQVTERVTEALCRIAKAHASKRVIVVAHGGALSMALAQLVDGDYTAWKHVMDNCAVSELVVEPAPRLLTFNHTDHLIGL